MVHPVHMSLWNEKFNNDRIYRFAVIANQLCDGVLFIEAQGRASAAIVTFCCVIRTHSLSFSTNYSHIGISREQHSVCHLNQSNVYFFINLVGSDDAQRHKRRIARSKLLHASSFGPCRIFYLPDDKVLGNVAKRENPTSSFPSTGSSRRLICIHR